MKKTLHGKTAVIIGASSGIGRAIALTLAREKMNLILAARRENALKEVALECENLGGSALAVRTDVTSFTDVENLIGKARTFFGDIDIWINNAAVMAVGEFNDTPLDVHEQVIKTDLMGPLYGAYAILPYFKQRGRGTIINTISLGAYVPNPFSSSYSASKFGLRGLFEAIRDELTDFKNIHICDVNPAYVDTPGPLHAANYTGKELQLSPPLYDPYQVAEVIKKLILKPKARVMIGATGRIARLIHALAPNRLGKHLAKAMSSQFKIAGSRALTHGNIFTPMKEGTKTGVGEIKRPVFLKWLSKLKISPAIT